jgi:hypothetical protein
MLSSNPMEASLQRKEEYPTNPRFLIDKTYFVQYTWLSSAKILNMIYIFIIVGFFITFLLYNLLETNRIEHDHEGIPRVVTVSDTGSYPPEQFIFTALLHIVALLFVILFTAIKISFTYRIRMCEDIPEQSANTWLSRQSRLCRYLIDVIWCGPAYSKTDLLWINNYLWVLGLLTAFFLALVGSVPVASAPTVHGTAAVLMVICGVLYMIFFYLKISRSLWLCAGGQIFGSSKHYFICQYIGLLLVIPVELAIGITSAVLSVRCSSVGCQYYVYDTLPYLEYVAFVAFLIYIESFRYEIRGIILSQSLPSSASMAATGAAYEV